MKDNLRYTILYVRISKDDDFNGDSNSITNQISILQKYATEHGYTNIKIIKDDGYTGTNFNRPGFQEMFSLVKSRQVERILVKDLSRLGRNYVQTGHLIDIEFPRYNVQFIAVNENFDSVGGDKFLVAMHNLVNELYALDISNKQKMSIRAKSDSGRHITSKIPFGYKLNPNDKTKWIIDEPAAETVRLIFKLYNEGMQILEICKYLKEHKYLSPSNHTKKFIKGSRAIDEPYYWCTSSVMSILERQEYIGDTVNFKTYHASFKDRHVYRNSPENYVIIKNTQEAIIPCEVFEKAQERRKKNKRVVATRVAHLLDGMIYCSQCKNKMYLNRKKRKNEDVYIYLCNSYNKSKQCTAHYIREDVLIRTVLDSIETLQNQFLNGRIEFRRYISSAITNRTSDNVKQVKMRMVEIQKRLDELRMTEANIYQEKLTGKVNDDTFYNITHILDKEIENLTYEHSQLIIILDMVEDSKKGIDKFIVKLENYSHIKITEDDRFIIEQLVDHIEIHEDNQSDVSIRIFYADIGLIE